MLPNVGQCSVGRLMSRTLEQKAGKGGMDTLFQKANNVFTEAVLGMRPTWISASVFFSTLPHLGYFIKRMKDLTEQLEKIGEEMEKLVNQNTERKGREEGSFLSLLSEKV